MTLADNFISLKDGKIIEAGSSATILQGGCYNGKLGLSLPSAGNMIKMTQDAEHPGLSREVSRDPAYITEENGTLATDVRRKNGDISFYKYYLMNAGYRAVGLYVFSVIIWIFCTEFSSESSLLHHLGV